MNRHFPFERGSGIGGPVWVEGDFFSGAFRLGCDGFGFRTSSSGYRFKG